MLVDQEAFRSGLICTGEGKMAGPRPHNLDEKDTAHGGTGGFQRLDGLIRQRYGRMKTQGGRSRDIIVDRARNPDSLNPKSFVERPRATKTPVSTDDHQGSVFHVGPKMPHGGLLHLLVLKIFESAAPNRTARMAAHTAGILLGHGCDPVVGQT